MSDSLETWRADVVITSPVVVIVLVSDILVCADLFLIAPGVGDRLKEV